MTGNEIIGKIEDLKRKRNAIILAHVYQRGEIQEIADYVGDSLQLSKKTVNTDARVIVFCGVRFMAETASILNPDKIVLLPEYDAGCPLADMATVDKLKEMKKKFPKAAVVSYINSSASIKAVSDTCCTSSNAVEVVNSLPQKEILFLPDKNLAEYVATKTKKKIIPWAGYCYIHEEKITDEKIEKLKQEHPDAIVLAHPECNQEVIKLADYVGSTSQMQKFARDSDKREFIIGTEDGIIYPLEKANPTKKFYPSCAVCRDMKLTTLESVLSSLEHMRYEIKVLEDIRIKAKRALDRMLKI